ncbi:PH domain-containing protein [Aspergillus brunneoviolaceus CBS 621.78]|uniref:PH domain protein n=1 Tax=Aspergillus brunneoviolaceus CBS 621.78 TaxID=1450534 RepID=A0ACD1FTR4_9EURO|nr:PH domain protein [Aspergillus brunneoviolaceus CBS 621.78]RAH40393.1 PH domain protein [Aspergillus brunneoviolaceus CBS 621.78]
MTQAISTSCPPIMEGSARAPVIHLPDGQVQRSSTLLSPTPNPTHYRNGHVNLDTFSPVNENGSFEFDRVIKTGKVFRRVKHKHAFRASWKPAYLVLRPNLLSVYKDEETTRLRASITLSEVTAVASVRSPRSNRQYVFGIFSPSKNYRFQAATDKEAEDWIRYIRAETRMDEDEEAFLALSKPGDAAAASSKRRVYDTTDHSDFDQRGRPSSPELGGALSPAYKSRRFASPHDHSANDITSYSEWSDGPGSNTSVRLRSPSAHNRSASALAEGPSSNARETGRVNDAGVLRDPERVVCNGYLQCLRIKGSMRQWKRLWVVLRPSGLGFYKDEQEYSAIKIIPMSQVIDAAEIDPMSRSKNFCLQIIAEEKSYRLCTADEESLAKWLGSLKSILVARKKLEPTPAGTTGAAGLS